jgi:O-antigen ligase
MYNNFEIFELLRYRIGLFSSDLRFEQFDKSIEIIQNNLIIGVGIGGYGIAEGNIDQVSYPHNFILEIFAETGIFISTIMIIFLLYFFIKRYLILRINEFGIQIYLVSFYLFLQAMKSGGIVDIRMLLFWVGCTITYAKIYKKFNNFITK